MADATKSLPRRITAGDGERQRRGFRKTAALAYRSWTSIIEDHYVYPMSSATKRTILRCVHLILSIPILGYIYQPTAEVEQYAGGVRFIFLPILMLSGYWMYAGLIFAIIGVALWLAAYRFSGFGAALLTQVVLFIARMIWLKMRSRSRNAGEAR